MNAQLIEGGGAIIEVGGVQKPQAAVAIVKRVREYLRAMVYAGKPVSSVLLRRDQYSTLHMAATKGRDDAAPPVVGLQVDGVLLRVEGGKR